MEEEVSWRRKGKGGRRKDKEKEEQVLGIEKWGKEEEREEREEGRQSY